jgi:threonine/homoserine/homoserine lactone efflux protein
MLDFTQILSYVIALSIAAAIPGPGIITLIVHSISQGGSRGLAVLLGIVTGDLIYLSFAVFGLAFIASSFAELFIVIKWGAVSYLCYLAWQFWRSPQQSVDIKTGDLTNQETVPKGANKELQSAYFCGFMITMGNPKTIAFYLALLPVVIDLQIITVNIWLMVLIPLTVCVLLAVGGLFIMGAVAIRHKLTSKRVQKIIHKSASLAMFSAAASLVSKEI